MLGPIAVFLYRKGRTSYKEDAWNVIPGVLKVFRFDMLEGSERSLDEPNSVVLPESMARKIFGDEIIGFIPDIKFASFRQEVTPMAFYLWGKYQWGQEGNYYDAAYVKFKAGSDLRAGMEHVRESLEKFDSEYPFVVRFYRRGFAAYLRKGIEDRLLDHLVQPCRYLYFDRGRVRPCRVRERVQAERDCRAQGVGIDDGRNLVYVQCELLLDFADMLRLRCSGRLVRRTPLAGEFRLPYADVLVGVAAGFPGRRRDHVYDGDVSELACR